MSKQTKTILIVSGIAILCFIVFWLCNKPKPQPSLPIPVKTDTIHKTVYIPDTIKSGGASIPPQTVTLYQKVPVYLTVHDTTLIHDTFGIPSLRVDTLRITGKFNMPQIILGRFYKDSLTLDLFDGTQILSRTWPVNYDGYRYQFWNDKLAAYPYTPKNGNPVKSFLNAITTESYLYTTYNPFTKGAQIRLDYSITYKKVALYTFGQISTDQSPTVNAGVGLKLKLK